MRDRSYASVRQTAIDVLAGRSRSYVQDARTLAEEWLAEFEPLTVVDERGEPRERVDEGRIDQPRKAFRPPRPPRSAEGEDP